MSFRCNLIKENLADSCAKLHLVSERRLCNQRLLSVLLPSCRVLMNWMYRLSYIIYYLCFQYSFIAKCRLKCIYRAEQSAFAPESQSMTYDDLLWPMMFLVCPLSELKIYLLALKWPKLVELWSVVLPVLYLWNFYALHTKRRKLWSVRTGKQGLKDDEKVFLLLLSIIQHKRKVLWLTAMYRSFCKAASVFLNGLLLKVPVWPSVNQSKG